MLASKGQPMSIAYDPHRSLVLFGSEAESVAVPVDKSGQWLPERIGKTLNVKLSRLED